MLIEKELMEFATTSPNPEERMGPVALPTFEYNLVRLARFAVGQLPLDQVAKNLANRLTTPPPCVSRNCVRLVQDTLAKGLMLRLVQFGGWRKERFLRQDHPVHGRIWERIPLAERVLAFSGAPLAFLIWLNKENVRDRPEPPPASCRPQTAADEMFFLLMLDAVHAHQEFYQGLSGLEPFRASPLCWLAHPAAVAPAQEPQLPDFAPSFVGCRAAILECLQADLTKRWIRSEREKGKITSWTVMRHQGTAELAVLTAYLAAANAANRWDLVRFVLNSLSAILQGQSNPMPSFWTGGLHQSAPTRLADRLETQRVALALLRQMETLRQWNQRAKSVGHFDEDYNAKQLWKLDWEAAQGDRVVNWAQKIVERIEPLRTT